MTKGTFTVMLGQVFRYGVVGVLNNLLNLYQVPAFTQILIKGLIVIAAILADRPGRRAQPA